MNYKQKTAYAAVFVSFKTGSIYSELAPKVILAHRLIVSS